MEGDLRAALAADDGRALAAAAGVLLAVGRGAGLEAAYMSSRVPRLVAAWEQVGGGQEVVVWGAGGTAGEGRGA